MAKVLKILRQVKEIGWKNFFYRLYYELAKKTGWIYLKFLINRPSRIELLKIIEIKNGNWLEYFRQRKNPKFLINPLEQNSYHDLWLKKFSNQKEGLIRMADKICSHQMNIFNLDKDLGLKINWHQDPVSKNNWPEKHWSLISIDDKEKGDIKYSWQLNRFQHFYILGRAYWISHDEKYAQEFISEINDWIKNNPPEIGINWLSSLEIAVRLISWTWAFYFFINSPALSSSFLENYLKTIYLMARHIEKNINFSKYCIRNDHYLGEGAALFIIGMIFPEFQRAKKWQRIGWQIIEQETERQFLDDGVYFMYSPTYQRFTMDFLLTAIKIAQLNNLEVQSRILKKMNKAYLFIFSLMNKDGYIQNLGENDGSLLFLLSQLAYMNFRGLIENYSMLLKKSPAFDKNTLLEETFWLFGSDYLDKKERNIYTQPLYKKDFNAGGYYILENAGKKIIFICSKNKSNESHADSLSFVMEIDGSPIFLDNGTYLYNADKKWRDYFKGTSSHNTVVVDGQDQMINWRKFRWLDLTKSKLISLIENKYVEGEHTGYTRLKNPVIHRRALSLKEKQLIVNDSFSGSGIHQLDFYFHLPKCDYQINQKTKELIAKIDSRNIKICPEKNDMEIAVFSAAENPVSGWHSPAYGLKIPCLTLKYSLKTNIPYQSKIIISF